MGILSRFFGSETFAAADPNHSEDLRKVEALLEHLPEAEARLLASFALLLGRVAHADMVVSAEERARMTTVLESRMGLDPAKASAVMELAVERVLAHSLENHIILRQINQFADKEKKVKMVRALFELACHDDISETESEEIRLIAKAMLLPSEEFLRIRSEFRDHLAILKNLPRASR